MSQPTFPGTLETEHPHAVWIIQPPRRRLWIHIVLLLATFISTMMVGSRIAFNFEHRQSAFCMIDDCPPLFALSSLRHPSELLPVLPCSLTLRCILLARQIWPNLY